MSMDFSKYSPREFYRKLFSLMVPIAFQSFMVAAVNASDALMLARLDQVSLSAVSLATQVAFIANMFLLSFNSGLSIFAAQYWGKNDIGSIERIFAYVLRSSALVSALFSFASLFFPELLMKAYTSDEELIREGCVYLRAVSPTFLMAGVSQIFLCVLKNSEHALSATVITSVSVVLNIALNAVFIYGMLFFPRMGIKGAALATVVSRTVELVWSVAMNARRGSVRLRLSYFLRVDAVLRRDFWHYSYPVLVNQIVWGVGFSMYSVIMGHLGSDAVAANSISNIVKNLVTCLSSGISAGGGIMIGNELGRGNLERAKIYGSKICHIAIGVGAAMGIVIVLLIPFVLSIVSMSAEAAHYLKWMLVMCSYNMIGKSSNVATNCGIFPAGGDAKFSMICDSVTMWAVCVPAGLLVAFVFHAPVLLVFFIINLDEMVKLPAIFIYYKKYRWLRNITR